MAVHVGAPEYGGAFRCEPERPLFGVLPGELVELTGEIAHVLQPSPHRVQPACIHFGACGGCQYQHAGYPAQLAVKLQILQDLFSGAQLSAPVICTYAAEPWAYRNRIRVRLEALDGVLRPGYNRRGSNEFLPISMCPIAAPLLLRAAEALAALHSAGGPAARWVRSACEAELFCTPAQDGLQMQLLLARADPIHTQPGSFAQLCEQLRTALPELAGAGAAFSPDAARRLRRAGVEAGWGKPGLLYPVSMPDSPEAQPYWVSRGAFFQVNRFLIGELVRLVCAGHTGRLAWDLFAGAGLFTRPLAERFTRVIAVEGAPAAAADLATASRGKTGPGFTAHHQSTLDFLRTAQHQRERPDLIVLDPPRAGLGSEGAAILNHIAAPAVVYVSCDPTTLVRDLRTFASGGYMLESIDLIDLFPQTFHIETVVQLRLPTRMVYNGG